MKLSALGVLCVVLLVHVATALVTPTTFYQMTKGSFGSGQVPMAALQTIGYDSALVETAVANFEKLLDCWPVHEGPWCQLVLDAPPFNGNVVRQAVSANAFMTEALLQSIGTSPCYMYTRAAMRACHMIADPAVRCVMDDYRQRCEAMRPAEVSRDELLDFRTLLHMMPNLPLSGQRLSALDGRTLSGR